MPAHRTGGRRGERERSLSPQPASGEWRPIFDTPASPEPHALPTPGSPPSPRVASPAPAPPVSDTAPRRMSMQAAWPKSSEELRHLIEEPLRDFRENVASFLFQPAVNPQSTPSLTFGESPLTGGEALLNRPVTASDMFRPSTQVNRSLAALLSGYQTSSTFGSSLAASVSTASENISSETVTVAPAPEQPPLGADFVQDVTVLDGTVFPPGAEFVKCWLMRNPAGGRDWPQATELVFVAGESLARDRSVTQSVRVGGVRAGDDIELWTGELKVETSLPLHNFAGLICFAGT